MNNLEKRNRELSTYDPWRDFFDMGNFFSPELVRQSRGLPAVNIAEDDKNYTVDIVAPGFRKGDFKVNVEEDILTISAESREESADEGKQKRYSRREYSYNAFSRSFKLPDNAKDDAITAAYTDGVLKLSIPKSEQQVKAKKEITIG